MFKLIYCTYLLACYYHLLILLFDLMLTNYNCTNLCGLGKIQKKSIMIHDIRYINFVYLDTKCMIYLKKKKRYKIQDAVSKIQDTIINYGRNNFGKFSI